MVVELPDGHKQLIPARWTESNAGAVTTEGPLFSPASLRALVKMVMALSTQQQPEACHDHNTVVEPVDDSEYRDPGTTDFSVDRTATPPVAGPTVAPKRRNQ